MTLHSHVDKLRCAKEKDKLDLLKLWIHAVREIEESGMSHSFWPELREAGVAVVLGGVVWGAGNRECQFGEEAFGFMSLESGAEDQAGDERGRHPWVRTFLP